MASRAPPVALVVAAVAAALPRLQQRVRPALKVPAAVTPLKRLRAKRQVHRLPGRMGAWALPNNRGNRAAADHASVAAVAAVWVNLWREALVS